MVAFRAEAPRQGSALEREAGQVAYRDFYMCFLKVLVTEGLD